MVFSVKLMLYGCHSPPSPGHPCEHCNSLSLSLSFGRYAASVGATHFLTSAKLNKGIPELFLDLSKSEYTVARITSQAPQTETYCTIVV